jgi:hypothetical protein
VKYRLEPSRLHRQRFRRSLPRVPILCNTALTSARYRRCELHTSPLRMLPVVSHPSHGWTSTRTESASSPLFSSHPPPPCGALDSARPGTGLGEGSGCAFARIRLAGTRRVFSLGMTVPCGRVLSCGGMSFSPPTLSQPAVAINETHGSLDETRFRQHPSFLIAASGFTSRVRVVR